MEPAGLLFCTVMAQLALVTSDVATNYWRNAFFQTLQDKDWKGFFVQFGVFSSLGVLFISATVYQRYFMQWLSMRWRRWLTIQFLDKWLDGPTHYRAMIADGYVDNPDQRIAEDIRQFIPDKAAAAAARRATSGRSPNRRYGANRRSRRVCLRTGMVSKKATW